MLSRSSLLAIFVACCLLVALSGCSSTSFVGRQFTNFTAYYNGFYNAKQAFREGQNAIEGNQDPIDVNTYLSLYPRSQGTSAQSFDSAIKKSADLLRNHPQSKWVDEAVLLIGKSYYYQQNYVGSEQKFREVMTLDSEHQDEARLWLARTLMASDGYTEAIDLIRERLSEVDEPDRWTARMQMMLGELYVQQEEWEQAVEALEEGLTEVGDNRLGARGQFLLGQVYETLDAYGKAAEAYDRVHSFNPLYELSYAARTSYARVAGLNGDPERALRVISDMQRDDKHFEKRGELALLRARVLQAAGQLYDARNLYETILYDEQQIGGQRGQDVQQRVYYRLAELYRDELDSYPLAAAYFDSAATGGRTSSSMNQQDVKYTPDAIVNVSEQADRYRQFTDQIEEVNRLDSLLYLGSLDQAEFDSVIQEIRVERAEEARRQAELRREEQARQNFQSRSRSLQSESGRGGRSSSTQSAVAAAKSGDAGFLFHDDPVQLQQNRSKFQLTWGERPLVPDWRRRAAIRGRSDSDSVVAGGEEEMLPAARDEQEASMLPPVNTSDVPRDSTAQVEMRRQRAQMWYRLGNTLFLQMNQPDSAATWYRKVITDDETRTVAQRAYYALSEVYRSQGDTAAVRRLYQQIASRYPSSSFAKRAQAYLEGNDATQAAVLDSLQRAREAYAEAYKTWQNEKAYEEAVDRMLAIARSFHTTSVAPRALLAAGYIYLEWAEKESLDPQSEIPLGEPSLCCNSINGLSDLQLEEDGGGRFPDSLFAQPLYLENLYASLEDSYPGTPHADRARRLRESIFVEARSDSVTGESPPPGVDSTATAGPAGRIEEGTRADTPTDKAAGEGRTNTSESVSPSDTSAVDPVSDKSPPSNMRQDSSAAPDTSRVPREEVPDVEP